MAARTTDLSVNYRGVPLSVPVVVTSAETWFAGSLIYRLAAGNATKTWATTLPFLGISPFQQVIPAGGQGIIYCGNIIAIFNEDTTGGVVLADEGDGLYAEAAGDNYKDLVKRAPAAVVDGTSFVGTIFKVLLPEVWVALKPVGVSGLATVQAATVAAPRF